MVAAAFFTALWQLYPRYRSFYVVCTLVLAVALVGTDHHFLSDVIVGGYVGVAITMLTKLCFEKMWRLDL
jgi:membrane-associated phospholipid phosphatase